MSVFGKKGTPMLNQHAYAYGIWQGREQFFREVHSTIIMLAKSHPEIDFIIKPKREMLNLPSWTLFTRLLDELKVDIPEYRIKEAKHLVSILNDEVVSEFPWHNDMKPSTDDNVEGVLRKTWKPALSIIGADGIPSTSDAGNVLRPYTTLQLSIRIPPTVRPKDAVKAIEKILKDNIPYGATVKLDFEKAGEGWNAPQTEPWLLDSIENASKNYFGQSACYMGEGVSIPFMGMLGRQFPKAQFVITGVLGPQSNAHGPNEFLHIPFAKNLTCCISSIITDFQ